MFECQKTTNKWRHPCYSFTSARDFLAAVHICWVRLRADWSTLRSFNLIHKQEHKCYCWNSTGHVCIKGTRCCSVETVCVCVRERVKREEESIGDRLSSSNLKSWRSGDNSWVCSWTLLNPHSPLYILLERSKCDFTAHIKAHQHDQIFECLKIFRQLMFNIHFWVVVVSLWPKVPRNSKWMSLSSKSWTTLSALNINIKRMTCFGVFIEFFAWTFKVRLEKESEPLVLVTS